MAYSIDIINLCIYNYNNKINISKIASKLNISRQTIYNWLIRYEYYFNNNIYLSKIINKNNIHGLSKIHLYQNIIINFIENNQGCNLNDIYKNCNMNISKSSICRLLKNNNYSYKKINNRSIPYDKTILDNTFMNTISIDECSFCINDYKQYGYSKKNIKFNKYYKHKQVRERYTLLMAINKENIIDYIILKGGINLEIYKNFFIKNKNNFYNNTILHDNLRVHHANLLKDYCKSIKINLLYTPGYSPDFNPIERVFSELKRSFRKIEHHNNLKDNIITIINNFNNDNLIKYYNCSLKYIYQYRN
jgi:transposase